MARPPWCGEEIYDAANWFRERCLLADGSLFSDDRSIWTVESLRAVDAQVSRDLGTGSWLDKLQVQVEDLGPERIQLGAELVYMLLLPQYDTLAATKRAQLKRF